MKCKSAVVLLCLVIGLAISESVAEVSEVDMDGAASEEDLSVAESVGGAGGKGGGAAGKAAAAGGAVGAFAKGASLMS